MLTEDLTISQTPYTGYPQFQARPEKEDVLAGSRGKRIGIFIVTYNAVTTLAHVLRRITPQVWDNVEEVAVFDDASIDATYELAVGVKTLAGRDKFQVVKNHHNLGYGGNQKAGYAYFLRKQFDIVVLLHGDGQYAPEVLSHIYQPLVSGEADAVFGSRMMKTYGGPLKGGMPLYKYIGNRILTTLENKAIGTNLSEFHSGYRAYSLEALKHIDFSSMTNDFHFDTEIILKLHHQGYRIKEVPIPTYYGNEICYVNGLKYAKNVVRAVRRYKATTRSMAKYPEFQEYFIHYPLKESKYSSHYYFQSLTGRYQKVLDVGCGNGFMAAKIAAQGNRVVGIDVLKKPSQADAFDQYVCSDISHGLEDSTKKLLSGRFDKILLMDILEHLVNPQKLLGDCRDLLEDAGQLLVSVPNVANITVRLALAFGRFDYTERGILDKTHLRFFTRNTCRRMLEENGFEILHEKMTVMPIELLLGLSAQNPLMKFMTALLAIWTALLPGLLGYQTVLVARRRRNEHRELQVAVPA